MKRQMLLSLFFVLLLVACNGNGDEDEPTPLPPPMATEAGYPPPPAPTPTVGEYPPPPPATLPPPAGYELREELIWITHAAGLQCSETLIYPDLEAATTDLETAGITIYAAEEVGKAVCEACDCPTSQHYRVQIDSSELPLAEQLEWFVEE